MLLVSCERDTWGVEGYKIGTGEPINVLIPFEIPQSDNVAITRGMSDIEEHNIINLYILVFNEEGKLYYHQYYDSNRLNEGKVNYSNTKDWKSVNDNDETKLTNSTYGTIMAKAISETCYIYGIANVNSSAKRIDGESTEDLETFLDNGLVTTEDNSTNATTIQDLYDKVVKLKYKKADILNRDNSHLLMSGVFEMNDRYKTKDSNDNDAYSAFESKYEMLKAGKVDFDYIVNHFPDDDIVDVKKGEGENKSTYIDLTKAGVLKLRRLASHINFKITIDDKVFSDFKPESWQVFHVPTYSYLMDQGDEMHRINDQEYVNSDEIKSMIHAEGSYNFDFYMYENFKSARDISSLSGDDLNYYKGEYGNTLETTTKMVNDTPETLSKILPGGIYYENAAVEVAKTHYTTVNAANIAAAKSEYPDEISQMAKDNFTYAKRELAIKAEAGTYVKNVDQSKNFVYVEPYATYVVIKGRLRFNPTNFKLTNLLTGESTKQENVSDSYADVTYTVHLGYARQTNIKGDIPANPGEGVNAAYEEAMATYKLKDFNSLRNTKYTYNIQIKGINSIFTQVETETPDDTDKREVAQLQPGAAGFIGKASGKVFDLDAHYNSFVVFFSKKQLEAGANGFHFEIKTPWNTISLDDCLKEVDGSKVLDKDAYENWLMENPDFNWIKFRRNYDQTLATKTAFNDNVNTSALKIMPYFVDNTKVLPANRDPYQADCPLIDLYQLVKELEKFAKTGLPAKKGSTDYSALKLDDLSEGEGLLYTVFLDEYYYQTPPLHKNGTSPGTPEWNTASDHEPYWHFFVNRPARYVSFGTAGSSYTHDGESSKIEPEMMIVQHSIQSHYATAGGVDVGLGMEHYNDTPHPRWIDKGGGIEVTKGGNRKFGWVNAKNAIVKKDNQDANVSWFEYVADYVGLFNNITMTPAGTNSPHEGEDDKNSDIEDDYQYVANAVRLCLNRNRDENGDGKIDESELKWYLPASEQIDIINMCHFSFSDPLLNYNDYLNGTDANNNVKYRLTKKDGSLVADYYGRNFYQYHFVTSDYMKLIGEEMMNLNTYNQYGNWTTRPGEMRCVRNLGTGKGVSGSVLDKVSVSKPYFSYNSEGVASGTLSAESQDNPASVPGDIFKFEPKKVSGKWTKKWFIMESRLDSRSIRTAKYVNEELPPNYMFSETNRPYKAFQVAQDATIMSMKYYGKNIGGKRFIDLKEIYTKSPCGQYSEEADGSDLGSWRAPNAAELSLMAHYLRVNNSEGKATDSQNLFFGSSTDPQPFSTTSENWTGNYWVRLVGIKNDGTYTRKLYLSDPYQVTESNGALSFSMSYVYDKGNAALRDGVSGVLLRCVKDIEPPLDQ